MFFFMFFYENLYVLSKQIKLLSFCNFAICESLEILLTLFAHKVYFYILSLLHLSLLAWFWGDPHINTLDGRMYTFNGLGEYTLVQLGDQFELQARTDIVPGTTATQFTACAMASPTNGTRVEVSYRASMYMLLVKIVF